MVFRRVDVVNAGYLIADQNSFFQVLVMGPSYFELYKGYMDGMASALPGIRIGYPGNSSGSLTQYRSGSVTAYLNDVTIANYNTGIVIDGSHNFVTVEKLYGTNVAEGVVMLGSANTLYFRPTSMSITGSGVGTLRIMSNTSQPLDWATDFSVDGTWYRNEDRGNVVMRRD
jgi:hypothetical protein